jgi:putative membrane protein
MRLHTITALLLLVAPCAGTLAAQGGLSDDIVLRQIHRANLDEIRMGQLAQRNGSSAQVKQYGATLVRDHQAADQKVVALAKQLRIAFPQERGQMSRGPGRDSDDRPGYMGRRDSTTDSTTPQSYTPSSPQRGEAPDHQPGDRLRSLRGAAFDTAFANAMVDAHNQAISLLELAQGQAQHEELRTLIASTLPALREHLQIAQSLASGTVTSGSSPQ